MIVQNFSQYLAAAEKRENIAPLPLHNNNRKKISSVLS